MPHLQQPLPAGGHEREELALIEIEHTTVSPFTVRLLLAFFLTSIAAVPIAEVSRLRIDASARQGGGAEGIAIAWSHLATIPENIRSYLAEAKDASLWDRIVSGNRILMAGLSGFERALENESLIGQSLRPPAQLVIARWLGAGNERVYLGLDRWLFYSPDVDYVTGPGFLDQAQLRRRVKAAPEWTAPPQPDPRPAITQFKADLEARGITLVVMPTPLKPGVHAEMLTRRYADSTGVLQNPSYQTLVDDLKREGVLVFDPSEALIAARRTGPLYLATDTHWRPEAMELVAELLGSFVAGARLPTRPDPGYRVERLEVRNTGDAARMLDLPADHRLFPIESVWLRRVLHSDGSPWRASRDADVLLLGDSFSNIYSLESMGWGTSAGLAEQLSYALRRPVDRLVQNDEGSFATRAMLQRDPERLHGKRVVVYQFAARELASGDWKSIPLPVPGSR
jgi:alginate O-acetyltransferase complex protein AlgJ